MLHALKARLTKIWVFRVWVPRVKASRCVDMLRLRYVSKLMSFNRTKYKYYLGLFYLMALTRSACKSQQRELTVVDWRHAYTKGHNKRPESPTADITCHPSKCKVKKARSHPHPLPIRLYSHTCILCVILSERVYGEPRPDGSVCYVVRTCVRWAKARQQCVLYCQNVCLVSQGPTAVCVILSERVYGEPRPDSSGGEQIRVIVLAYMRTGSSMTGSLLDVHPDVFYWYEPLHTLGRDYSRLHRHLNKWSVAREKWSVVSRQQWPLAISGTRCLVTGNIRSAPWVPWRVVS